MAVKIKHNIQNKYILDITNSTQYIHCKLATSQNNVNVGKISENIFLLSVYQYIILLLLLNKMQAMLFIQFYLLLKLTQANKSGYKIN